MCFVSSAVCIFIAVIHQNYSILKKEKKKLISASRKQWLLGITCWLFFLLSREDDMLNPSWKQFHKSCTNQSNTQHTHIEKISIGKNYG
jgi:hypothetical protein